MKTNVIKNESGFTLIELILVVAIVGMLSAAIAPSFTTLLANSGYTSAKGTIGSVQSAINTAISENIVLGCSNTISGSGGASTCTAANGARNLATLDTNANTTCTTCFSSVSSSPLSSGNWRKTSASTYVFTPTGSTSTLTYTYSTGTNRATFTCTGTNC